MLLVVTVVVVVTGEVARVDIYIYNTPFNGNSNGIRNKK